MSEAIVVSGCKFKFPEGSTGKATITTLPSSFTKINSKGVYSGPINVSITGWTNGTIKAGTGSGVINPNAKYTKADGKLVFLKGAKSESIPVTGTIETQPYTDTKIITIEISDAGQSEIKGE